MAINFNISQIGVEQVIAVGGTFYPSKLIFTSNRMPGYDNYNGGILDTYFLDQIQGSDVAYIFSGSKGTIGTPVSDANQGVVLFTGDVVISGSTLVAGSSVLNPDNFFLSPSTFVAGSTFGTQSGGANVVSTTILGSFGAGVENVSSVLIANSIGAVVEASEYISILNGFQTGNPDPPVFNVLSSNTIFGVNVGVAVVENSTASAIMNSREITYSNSEYNLVTNTFDTIVTVCDFNIINAVDSSQFYNCTGNVIHNAFGADYTSTSTVFSFLEEGNTMLDSSVIFAFANLDVNINTSQLLIALSNYQTNVDNSGEVGEGGLFGNVLINNANADVGRAIKTSLYNTEQAQVLSSSYINSFGDITTKFTSSIGVISAGNYNCFFENNASSTHPLISLGNYSSFMQNSTASFMISAENSSLSANRSGILGGRNNTIAAAASSSLIIMGEANSVQARDKIIIGSSRHNTWFSGSVSAQQISGSHQKLIDGTTPAYSTFTSASGPLLIQTASNGQVQYGSITRLPLCSYVTSLATVSSPQVLGSCILNPYEHEDVDNISGSYLKLRFVPSVFGSGNGVFVKLWDATHLQYVNIGGPGIDFIGSGNTSPFEVVSQMLTGSTLHFSHSRGGGNVVYELHAYYSGVNLPLGFQIHSAELIFSPRAYTGLS